MHFKTLPRFPLRWPSPAEMRAYARARRGEAIKAAQASGVAAKRKGNGSVSGVATKVAAPQPVGARARALVREQLKHGPRPEASIMAAGKAAAIPEPVLIAAACVLKVRTQRGQWWLPDGARPKGPETLAAEPIPDTPGTLS
jgi:hypothetical protein